MKHVIVNNGDAPIMPLYDINAEGGRVEIQKGDGVIWIHVEGHTVMRISKIGELKNGR